MNAPATPAAVANHRIEAIPTNTIALSTTHIQQGRRKRFVKAALEELKESIKTTGGVLSPILVRPHPKPTALLKFELVAGERRLIATGMVPFLEISAIVQDLDDRQVLEVQLIENLQREGLHEMEEAEGYAELMKLKGVSADDVALQIGKSRRYVFARIKLLELCPEVRKAFYDEVINSSVAFQLARIPGADLQKKALEEVTGDQWDGPMSARQAAEHISDEYMLRLDQAPFKTGDAELIPKAGACTTCPKRTGNQPELFGDVKSKDLCTDPKCFSAKREAQVVLVRREAAKSGQTVISGKAAKAIAPHGGDSSFNGHINLDATCYDEGGKNRTFRQILGKDAPEPKLLEVENHGGSVKMVEIVATKDVSALLKAKGVGVRSSSAGHNGQAAAEKKAQLETRIRARILHEVRAAKLGKPFDRDDLMLIAEAYFEKTWHENVKRVVAMWTPPASDGKRKTGAGDGVQAFKKRIPTLSNDELAILLLDLALVGEVHVNHYGLSSKAETLTAAAKRAKVDVAKIRAELGADAKPKKAAKKKGAK